MFDSLPAELLEEDRIIMLYREDYRDKRGTERDRFKLTLKSTIFSLKENDSELYKCLLRHGI